MRVITLILGKCNEISVFPCTKVEVFMILQDPLCLLLMVNLIVNLIDLRNTLEINETHFWVYVKDFPETVKSYGL